MHSSPPSFHYRACFYFCLSGRPHFGLQFAGAQTTAKLPSGRATLIEQLGIGCTSVAQFSTCTPGIVVGVVLASKVGSPLSTLWVWCFLIPEIQFPDVPDRDRVQCEVDPMVGGGGGL